MISSVYGRNRWFLPLVATSYTNGMPLVRVSDSSPWVASTLVVHSNPGDFFVAFVPVDYWSVSCLFSRIKASIPGVVQKRWQAQKSCMATRYLLQGQWIVERCFRTLMDANKKADIGWLVWLRYPLGTLWHGVTGLSTLVMMLCIRLLLHGSFSLLASPGTLNFSSPQQED